MKLTNKIARLPANSLNISTCHPERSGVSKASSAQSKDPYSLTFLSGVFSIIALAAFLCLTLGCTVGPHYHRPSATTPTAPNYKESL